ncbi:MAG: purine-nucleoside phosphorylase [Candidatus Kapabacteria bacterium]|nr:purine-nucleoside phosphorylase [Candidatus Kapabacteria bacterium]
MSTLLEQIDQAVASIRQSTSASPRIGIILGTGLGALVSRIEIDTTIPYESIPNFPVSTVESHTGRLVFGRISGKDVVVMQGRFHQYEGYTLQQVTFPVRVMKALGVSTLIVSNACGGLNPLYRRGDLMLIDDHINLLGDNPLVGPNEPKLGPRFPDMSEPYSRRLLEIAERCALQRAQKVHRGVYVAVTGPNLETRAEYRFLRLIGADVVGMSTVPECIVARHMHMDVLGVSIITDECFPDALQPVHLEHVLEAAAMAEPVLTNLVTDVIASLP